MDKLRKQRERQRQKKKGSERKVYERFFNFIICSHATGIYNSDICYGNPPFPWNLLETQEESFWFCSHDWTIVAGLIEWQKMPLIQLNACSIHMHTVYAAWGQAKSLMFAVLRYSISYQLQPTQITTHNPISSIWFLQINISFPSSMKTSVTQKL